MVFTSWRASSPLTTPFAKLQGVPHSTRFIGSCHPAAHALKEDRDRCLTAGMDGYVSKPLQVEQLIEAVERFLPAKTKRDSSVVNSVSAPTDESPLMLDRAAALLRVGGDDELLKEILDLFAQECPQYLAAIGSANRGRDPAKLHHAAHTFQGAHGNFGESPALTAAQALETMGHENHLNGAEATYQQLLQQMARLQPALAALAH